MLQRFLVLTLTALTLEGWAPVSGQTWTSELSYGARIEVDTTTNKPMFYSPEGAQVPLWDGVHQLKDGRTVTVRDGVMVPNEQVLDLQRGYPTEKGFVGEVESACEWLVRKVCGFDNECSDRVGCAHARQLQAFALEEFEERSRLGLSARFIEAPSQCREALRNEELFEPCNKDRMGGKKTPCGELVTKVCGDQDQCAGRAVCGPAKDLLEREFAERLAGAASTGVELPTSGQCQQALKEDGFFPSCSP